VNSEQSGKPVGKCSEQSGKPVGGAAKKGEASTGPYGRMLGVSILFRKISAFFMAAWCYVIFFSIYKVWLRARWKRGDAAWDNTNSGVYFLRNKRSNKGARYGRNGGVQYSDYSWEYLSSYAFSWKRDCGCSWRIGRDVWMERTDANGFWWVPDI
jgi:hypothetical protein